MRPNHHRLTVGDPKVGDRVLKHFQGFGKFEGAIVATRDESTDDCEVIIYEVRYDDGDTEEYLRREVQELTTTVGPSASTRMRRRNGSRFAISSSTTATSSLRRRGRSTTRFHTTATE